jgi:hypothetical protein
MRTVTFLSEEVLQQGVVCLEQVADQEEDPLKSLRSVLNKIVELAQLVEGFELEPSEIELRSINKELAWCKAKIHSLTRTFIASDDPAVAVDVHELLGEANEVMTRGQKCIHRLLQRLGVAPEGSETSSLKNMATGAPKPQPNPDGAPEEFFSFRWGPGGGHGRPGEGEIRTRERAGGDSAWRRATWQLSWEA